jgi:hypothetical protein
MKRSNILGCKVTSLKLAGLVLLRKRNIGGLELREVAAVDCEGMNEVVLSELRMLMQRTTTLWSKDSLEKGGLVT